MATQQAKLNQLKAKALKAYSQKDYATSAELYADACELQSLIQGEDNPKNGYLLYLYGRSLFEVALKKSDVLGGVSREEEKKPKEKEVKVKGKDAIDAPAGGAEVVIGDKALEGVPKAKTGLFQFTGDENWDDSDGEEEEDEEEGEKGEEGDDDFTLAWEILDYARLLFLRQLKPDDIVRSDLPFVSKLPEFAEGNEEKEGEKTEARAEEIPAGESEEKAEEKVEEKAEEKTEEKAEESTDKDTAPSADQPLSEEEIKSINTALADTYDLLGEVSLESESFAQAAKDLRSSLDLKLQLYPLDSTLISEAHFKLSLALEFAAAGEEVSDSDRLKGREAAAVEMEKAIASCKARIEKEEKLAEVDDKGKGKETITKSLADAREMVGELEARLADLRASPSEEAADPLRGILGQVLGEDQAAAKKRIEEAMSGARDLTGLVRKKQPATTAKPDTAASSTTPVAVGTAKPTENGKRKLDDLQEEDEVVVEESKKAKVSDGEEA